jgi:hypothetical protein
MTESPQRLDIETIVRDPADYFAAPIDVVNDSRFTHDEKHRILESWALDAQLRSQAEAENMPGKDDLLCRRSIWQCWSYRAESSRAEANRVRGGLE